MLNRRFLILLAGGVLATTCGLLAQAPAVDAPTAYAQRLMDRAGKGDAEAQYDLGKNYEAGRAGLIQNFVKAEHWYREAAMQNDPIAQASLGILYGFGKGVQPDLVQAWMWYELATRNITGGDRDTIAEMRDNLAAKMTPAQLSEARKRAGEWKPKTK